MEKLFYEARPYGLALIALYALKMNSLHPLYSTTCAVALLGCSGVIFFWRYAPRAQKAPVRARRK